GRAIRNRHQRVALPRDLRRAVHLRRCRRLRRILFLPAQQRRQEKKEERETERGHAEQYSLQEKSRHEISVTSLPKSAATVCGKLTRSKPAEQREMLTRSNTRASW